METILETMTERLFLPIMIIISPIYITPWLGVLLGIFGCCYGKKLRLLALVGLIINLFLSLLFLLILIEINQHGS
ncbi:MAG TPA: hypothetical protein DEV81_04775 [Cyanobacteria bacterium UBA11049]|nr:hypothetical protein [Cyanobacteria bacterium UBA11049]